MISQLNKQYIKQHKMIGTLFPSNIMMIIIDVLLRLMNDENQRYLKNLCNTKDTDAEDENEADSSSYQYFPKPSRMTHKIMILLAIHLLYQKCSEKYRLKNYFDFIDQLM